MTAAEYESLLASQGHRCAGCRRKRRPGENPFPVDHCHSSGAVRGILCKDCNFALGFARDNSKTLRALADYIDRTQQGALFWEGPTTAGEEPESRSA